MLRRMTITVALVILGTLSAGVLRAADQPSQAPSAEKQESATEKVGRATNTAAEKWSGPPQPRRRNSAIRGLPSRPS